MIRSLFLFSILFCAKPANCQVVSKETELKKLYSEAALYYMKVLKYQDKDEDSVQAAGKLAIEKYQAIYKLDAGRKSIGDYLADCYRYTRQYDSAIIWSRHQLGVYKDSFNVSVSNEMLAYTFILNGNIDSSIKYLHTAYIKRPRLDYDGRLFTPIVAVAEKLYTGSDSLLVKSIKKRSINPCSYSIQVLATVFPYADMVKNYAMQNLTKEYIKERSKKCLQKK